MTLKILIQDGIKRWNCKGNTQRKCLGKFVQDANTGSVQLQTVLAMCEKENDQNRAMPSYQRMKTMVRRRIRGTSEVEAISVDRQRNRPLLLQGRRHKMTEEDLQKETLPGEVVHPERKVKDRARITSKGIARVRRVIIGILPYVKNYKSEQGCTFGDKCLFRHTETDRQPSEKSKNSGGKDGLLC